MKTLSGIMSQKSEEEYLESCRQRYPSRNRKGKGAMIDEVGDAFGWDRKHTIKVLNGRVSLGRKAKKRGSKPTWGEAEQTVIVAVWRLSEQPCGVRLKETLPLWLESYGVRHGGLEKDLRERILGYSARTLERITAPFRVSGAGRAGRRTGRASNRIKKFVPVRCGPQLFDEPGWLEADTVSHGGGSSSGEFMWSLTLTDFHSGWTELAALWGNSGGEVRAGLERIEKRMPFEMLGFDCDNGSEFLNEVIERYLLGRGKKVGWTRSRPYKKNDQAHVEQKNFTHVRQLLGYGRFDDPELRVLVEDLYTEAWLPLRNHFTPVMKLVEKKRENGRLKKTYDIAATPCDRLLACEKVDAKTKKWLRKTRSELDPISLAEDIEARLKEIFKIVERIEEDRAEEMAWAAEHPVGGPAGADCAPASVAGAPSASAPSAPAGKGGRKQSGGKKTSRRRVS